MSKNRLLVLSALVGLAVLGGSRAFAQGAGWTALETNVPFEFVVDQATLPAGDYIIEKTSNEEPCSMTIRTPDGKTSLIFMANTLELPAAPQAMELLFNLVGGKHYLWQIWADHEKLAFQVSKYDAALRGKAGAGEQPQLKRVAARRGRSRAVAK